MSFLSPKLRDRISLTFFAPMKEPGKKMGPGAVPMLSAIFKRLGITERIGVPIKTFTERGVTFAEGEDLEADLTIFVPGARGLPLFEASGLPVNEAGFIQIDDQCRVPGLDGVWAVGDSAALEGPEFRAKQGHVAEIQARIAARDLALYASSAGKERLGDGYARHVNILCLMDVGNGAALVSRDTSRTRVLMLPVIGHWLKRAWGWYWKLSKLEKIPRLPGM